MRATCARASKSPRSLSLPCSAGSAVRLLISARKVKSLDRGVRGVFAECAEFFCFPGREAHCDARLLRKGIKISAFSLFALLRGLGGEALDSGLPGFLIFPVAAAGEEGFAGHGFFAGGLQVIEDEQTTGRADGGQAIQHQALA